MFRITTLLFLLIPFIGISQNQHNHNSIVEKEIQDAKIAMGEFKKASIFHAKKDNEIEALKTNESTSVKGAIYFDFEKMNDFNTKAELSSTLSLEIPSQNKSQPMIVDLIQVDIHSSDFMINVPYVQGFHYRGVVRGSDHSLVSISIFDEEVIGFVSYDDEVLTLGKVKGEAKTHVLYNEFKQNWDLETNCNTSDDDITYDAEKVAHDAADKSPGDCVGMKFEIDESLTNLLGGTTAATNYGTGLFNNQMTLYFNDGANIVLSELKIWTNGDPAPYTLDEYNTLNNYQNATGSYNGDVAYLGFYQGGWQGGIAAGIGGICQSNVDNTKAIGGHLGFYSNIPTYTYDVLIICHEVGHLFGARHTHACVWNGNNTAIDGCSGSTEGGCALPGSPSAGTIMSYCQPGDFVEGFDPQVSQAIQDYIASRNCTSPCVSNTVVLNLKTFLEGPYQEVAGTMTDLLRSNGHLPLLEPYTALGYTLPTVSTSIGALGQTGDDAIIDWILVELRSVSNPTVVIERQAALLQRDGDIVDVDGISPIEMDTNFEANVYVALRHRNHLGIRTASLSVTSSPISLDFTDPLTNLFGGSIAVKQIGAVSVMISGDANSDGTINSIDKNIYWRVQNGLIYDYSTFRADFNMDGTVNTVDKNILWRVNNSMNQQLD
ncbi:MAG: hypothetical protein ACI81Y_001833 [Glaciecola sp.]|jgi:hypothetical protein